MQTSPPLTSYQKFTISILALIQFTVVLDFMIMSPLGDILMKSLNLTPWQFGMAVSVYAFSAGFSGFVTAGIADRFDRKRLLLFFYSGFIAGTFMCGIAQSFAALLMARIITGLFGGVIGAVSMAIVTDLFEMRQRGRVIGFIQMGFGSAQILGVPIGLYLANNWGWRLPFLLLASLEIGVTVLIAVKLQSVTQHLALQQNKSPFNHLLHTLSKRHYYIGFISTGALSICGFMLIPFGSVFAVNNLGVSETQLPMLFFLAGLGSLVMPLVGWMSDRFDKFKVFLVAVVLFMIVVLIYTGLSVTPLWLVIILNIGMMMCIVSRMIPITALVSAVPDQQDRGAFMSINTCLQQLSGGVAAAVTGLIVVQSNAFSPLQHYDIVGYVIVAISVLSIFLVVRVNKMVTEKIAMENVQKSNGKAAMVEMEESIVERPI